MSLNEINLDRLIKASNNDEAFVRSMLNLFIDRTLGLIDEMIESCNKKDYQQTIRLSHKLKPSVDMMGNDKMSELLFNIHEKTRTDINCKRSLEQIENLKKQTEKVIVLIKEKLNQPKII